MPSDTIDATTGQDWMTGLSDMNGGTTTATDSNNYTLPDYSSSGVDYSTGGTSTSWLSAIGTLASTGLGVFSTITKADQTATAQKLAAQQAQAKTAGTNALISYLPMLAVAAILILGAVFFFRSRTK